MSTIVVSYRSSGWRAFGLYDATLTRNTTEVTLVFAARKSMMGAKGGKNIPDLSKAETVFPASEAVRNFGVAKDALYVETLDGGVPRVWRVEYNGGKPQPLKLPYRAAAVAHLS